MHFDFIPGEFSETSNSPQVWGEEEAHLHKCD